MPNIEHKLRELPPDIYHEVIDFVNFLIQKKEKTASERKPKLNWAGSLKEYRKKYTSLELQKKASDWRG